MEAILGGSSATDAALVAGIESPWTAPPTSGAASRRQSWIRARLVLARPTSDPPGTGFQPPVSEETPLEIWLANLIQPISGDCAYVAAVGTPDSPDAEISPSATVTFSDFQLPHADLMTYGGLHCDTNGASTIGSTPGDAPVYLLSDPLGLSE